MTDFSDKARLLNVINLCLGVLLSGLLFGFVASQLTVRITSSVQNHAAAQARADRPIAVPISQLSSAPSEDSATQEKVGAVSQIQKACTVVDFKEAGLEKEKELVRRLMKDDIQTAESLPGADKVAMTIELMDLNYDSRPDILIFLSNSSFFCGSRGCTFRVLISSKDGSWKEGMQVNTTEEVRVSNRRSRAFRDIVLGNSIWRWTGERYEYFQKAENDPCQEKQG